jgi:hypothetical protein
MRWIDVTKRDQVLCGVPQRNRARIFNYLAQKQIPQGQHESNSF